MTQENFLFGVNPVVEKLNSAAGEISEILLVERPHRPALRKIEAEARRRGVAITYLPSHNLDRLSRGQTHQGVLARVEAYSYSSFSQLLDDPSASSGALWVLILDGLTDPRNFGALLRTAEAVGLRFIIIPKDRSVGVTPAVIKASAGAVHHLRICRVTNLRRAIADLKNRGFWIIGLDASAPDSIFDRSLPEKLGIVLGNEGSGIRPLILRECDFRLAIPMRGKLTSLNVSVAGGVFLFELLRQRERR